MEDPQAKWPGCRMDFFGAIPGSGSARIALCRSWGLGAQDLAAYMPLKTGIIQDPQGICNTWNIVLQILEQLPLDRLADRD